MTREKFSIKNKIIMDATIKFEIYFSLSQQRKQHFIEKYSINHLHQINDLITEMSM